MVGSMWHGRDANENPISGVQIIVIKESRSSDCNQICAMTFGSGTGPGLFVPALRRARQWGNPEVMLGMPLSLIKKKV